jgi:uncharacterized repeat protein (TIGR03803 family)
MKKLLAVLTLSSSLLVFSLTVNAQFTNLYNFASPYGIYPRGSLTYSAGKFYGMTSTGGTNNTGNIFCIDSNGNNVKDLWDFDGIGSNGEYPQGNLLLIGSKLYGMTEVGGTSNFGVVFSIDTNGNNYKTLWNFDDTGTNGEEPLGSLILLGGKLYGMTEQGGTSNDGTIFSIDTNGSGYKDLLNFDGANGAQPYGSLTYSLGKFFGMTFGGGASSDGTVFSIDSNGLNFKNLYSFLSSGPKNPHGSLLLSGKVLYGLTNESLLSYGHVFSIDTDGSQYNILYSFSVVNGAYPCGSLILSNGILYGTTKVGGPHNYGEVPIVTGQFSGMAW